MQSQKDDLGVEYGRLELEQATYAEPSRIDAEARAKLGMVTPRPQDIQLVRR
jgi:cell division protein FtsL